MTGWARARGHKLQSLPTCVWYAHNSTIVERKVFVQEVIYHYYSSTELPNAMLNK